MLPLILNQLGADNLNSLKKIATAVSAGGELGKTPTAEADEDDELPGVCG